MNGLSHRFGVCTPVTDNDRTSTTEQHASALRFPVDLATEPTSGCFQQERTNAGDRIPSDLMPQKTPKQLNCSFTGFQQHIADKAIGHEYVTTAFKGRVGFDEAHVGNPLGIEQLDRFAKLRVPFGGFGAVGEQSHSRMADPEGACVLCAKASKHREVGGSHVHVGSRVEQDQWQAVSAGEQRGDRGSPHLLLQTQIEHRSHDNRARVAARHKGACATLGDFEQSSSDRGVGRSTHGSDRRFVHPNLVGSIEHGKVSSQLLRRAYEAHECTIGGGRFRAVDHDVRGVVAAHRVHGDGERAPGRGPQGRDYSAVLVGSTLWVR